MAILSYTWLTIAIVGFLIELITPTFFFLSVAVGAILAFLLSLVWDCLIAQIILFVIVFVVFFIFLKPVIYKKNQDKKFDSDAMIGKIIVASEKINDQSGSVKFSGSIWQARSDKEIKKGAQVKIMKLEGNKLIVSEETK